MPGAVQLLTGGPASVLLGLEQDDRGHHRGRVSPSSRARLSAFGWLRAPTRPVSEATEGELVAAVARVAVCRRGLAAKILGMHSQDAGDGGDRSRVRRSAVGRAGADGVRLVRRKREPLSASWVDGPPSGRSREEERPCGSTSSWRRWG
jgi:hypothetical protein